ncbi:twin transmembrane helix small protein [Sabulicella glaciei]|uniref:Twin transmembrane helix small protein n=1 Tax=Sabulicella glaciei TaxID=2984948 RepID=A0ABT3NY40_9PROT|nr:twin transmembrane helix small protein [Roseococcus sp. MDT2-1-1]MCW8087046.1 twin transmembrane helix small protein [Roseococcus sp. MDT2-1-1]
MTTFLTFLVGAAMLAVLGVLFAGLIGMARGGSAQTSQKLMRYRVLLQGLALLLFAVLMLLMR